MKKKLLTFVLVLSSLFIGLDIVNADTLSYSYAYDNFDTAVSLLNNNSTAIQDMKDYWSSNYSNFCPYYVIDFRYVTSSPSHYEINLKCLNSVNYSVPYSTNLYPRNDDIITSNGDQYSITYNVSTHDFTYYPDTVNGQYSYWIRYTDNNNKGLTILDSNFEPIFERSDYASEISIPSYSDSTYNFPSYTISNNGVLPTITSLINGTYDPTVSDNYTEVNLQNYAYIILSLKNYNQSEFSTNIYTLGRLCFTPVYNYGMTEKYDVAQGDYAQECTPSYSVSTPVQVFLNELDIQNHAVYYIKAYDSSPNVVKVNSDIFDISYISTVNADNPSATIGGRSYPTIPYNDLSSSATSSTSEGLVSGKVCALGDLNCQGYEMGMDIADLFTHPLTLLQSIWTSIIGVFGIITTFMAVLPPTLQAFMYTSFMLGIVLGIIKIIL